MANKAVSQQRLNTENIREIRYFSQIELAWNDRNTVLLQKCVMSDGWYKLTILGRQLRWRDVFSSTLQGQALLMNWTLIIFSKGRFTKLILSI